MIFPTGDLFGTVALSAVFLGVLGIAELWTRHGHPHPEWTRKFVHMAGGTACAFFPFLIQSPWTVLLMALALWGLFAVTARTGQLRSLHAVNRETRGTQYFPLAVFVIFLLAHKTPWLYVSSILVLVVSDALAAVLGSRYGTLHYEVEEDFKSLEGSAVFLVFSFLAIHLPMLLMGDIPKAQGVLVALLAAAVVTGIEAICLRGVDNLLVPIAVFVLLSKLTQKPMEELVYQNLSLLGIVILVGSMVWRSRAFNVGGAILFMLFAYGTWSLGSRGWALPVLVGFLAYIVAWFLAPLAPERVSLIKVRILSRVLLPLFLLLLAANLTNHYVFFYAPYLCASAVVMSFSLWNHILWHRRLPRSGRLLGAGLVFSISWGIAVLLPWGMSSGVPWRSPLACAAVGLPLLYLNDLAMGETPSFEAGRLWPASRIWMTCAAAAAMIALQTQGWVPLWGSPI